MSLLTRNKNYERLRPRPKKRRRRKPLFHLRRGRSANHGDRSSTKASPNPATAKSPSASGSTTSSTPQTKSGSRRSTSRSEVPMPIDLERWQLPASKTRCAGRYSWKSCGRFEDSWCAACGGAQSAPTVTGPYLTPLRIGLPCDVVIREAGSKRRHRQGGRPGRSPLGLRRIP
jgi:hypothetical protein